MAGLKSIAVSENHNLFSHWVCWQLQLICVLQTWAVSWVFFLCWLKELKGKYSLKTLNNQEYIYICLRKQELIVSKIWDYKLPNSNSLAWQHLICTWKTYKLSDNFAFAAIWHLQKEQSIHKSRMAGFRVAPKPRESRGLLFRITHIDFQPQEKFSSIF